MPPSTGCRSASLRGKATRDLRSFRLAGRGAALPEAVDDWAPAGLDRIRRPVADALVAIVQIPGHSWHGALQVTRERVALPISVRYCGGIIHGLVAAAFAATSASYCHSMQQRQLVTEPLENPLA